MKTIVVYNSKTGFTKRYADWIAEALNCGAQSYKDFADIDIGAYDMIIFGGFIRVGKIAGLKKVKARFDDHSIGKLVVFATGATPAVAEDAVKTIWAGNFTDAELQSIPHFYMPGGLDYGKMGFSDRTVMKMVSKMLSGQKEKTDNEAGFEQALNESHDISSREYIQPLLRYVEDINQ